MITVRGVLRTLRASSASRLRRRTPYVSDKPLYNDSMERTTPLGLTLALLAGAIGITAEAPRPAAEVLASAESTAAQQHKSVFLIFHASW